MDTWVTIEVFDGESPATTWWRAHNEALIEAGLTNGARGWHHHEHRWGVVVEFEFADDEHAAVFRHLPAVVAVLDAVPDREAGLLVYRGRGGGAGARVPRRPKPIITSDAAALPVPEPELLRAGPGTVEPPSPIHA